MSRVIKCIGSYLLVAVCLLASLAAAQKAHAAEGLLDEVAIRAELLKLTEDDSEIRQSTLRTLARSRDGRLVQFFQAFNEGSLYLWNGQPAICPKFKRTADGLEAARLLDPLTRKQLVVDDEPVVVASSDLTEVRPSRQERRAVADAIRLLEIWSPDTEKQLSAIKRFGDSRDPRFLKPLQELVDSEPSSRIERKAIESILLIRVAGKLDGQTRNDRLDAIRKIGEMRSARAVPLMNDIINNPDDSGFHAPASAALKQIESYQSKIRFAQNVFNGISAGSILVLMALGLSIIFGQMGVINMAHGELMMIGAYATYEMQLLFGHTTDDPSNFYYVAALPVAFLSAGLVGYLIEKLVVKHLYGRPLESLLATWGVGLILIQAVRVKYGDNIGVTSPTWLVGSFEPVSDLVISFNRGFILLLCGLSVLFVYWLLSYTRLGLQIRATVQGRETANSLGVNTERIDGYTFALGSGLAGVAGYALTTVAGVTPDMGQNYIVDSFLVVVTGGVGHLWGAVFAGLGIGTLNKLLEPMTFGLGLPVLPVVICWVLLVMKAFAQGHSSRKVADSADDLDELRGWTARIARLKNWARTNRWGLTTFLLPIPMPIIFGIKHRYIAGVKPLVAIYSIGVIGIFASIICQSLGYPFGADIANTQIQAIWAKVLILACVVVFIQWEPLGLFPPKGRLADA